jgi:hypothetical protein
LIEIIKITADEWNEISEETMEYAFDESCWGPQMNRVSYAILAQDDKSKVPYGFATIVELDAQTGYIQHGGTFPSSKGSAMGGRGFLKIIEHLRHRYYHVQMRVKNTNIAMLKLCLKAGFVTSGIQMDKFGVLYLIEDLVETHG